MFKQLLVICLFGIVSISFSQESPSGTYCGGGYINDLVILKSSIWVNFSTDINNGYRQGDWNIEIPSENNPNYKIWAAVLLSAFNEKKTVVFWVLNRPGSLANIDGLRIMP